MWSSIFLLLASLHMPAAEAANVATDIRAVAISENPLFGGDHDTARLRTALLLAVWVWEESRGKAGAVGDAGRSVGAMQTGSMWLDGHTVAEVRADRRLGIRLGLQAMRWLRDDCGSVREGLRAYASGSCRRADDLVARRCAKAGVRCDE